MDPSLKPIYSEVTSSYIEGSFTCQHSSDGYILATFLLAIRLMYLRLGIPQTDIENVIIKMNNKTHIHSAYATKITTTIPHTESSLAYTNENIPILQIMFYERLAML